jgi:outer membrane murein-binding lipoprotein Lpp
MLDEILEILYRPITKRVNRLMTSVQQLSQQIQEVKDSLQSAIERVESDVENLKNQAGGIDPADLDPISQGLADLKANLDALDPDPDNPPTEPTPA